MSIPKYPDTYLDQYNYTPNNFIDLHLKRHEKAYKKLGVHPRAPYYAFIVRSANTNSCGTRAMAIGGGLNPSSKFHLLSVLLMGSLRWGKPNSKKGKQLVTHFTTQMYNDWKPLLDQLGVEGYCPFENSYGNKSIYFVPFLMNRDMYEVVRKLMEECYPPFLRDFDSLIYRSGLSLSEEGFKSVWEHADKSTTVKPVTKNYPNYCNYDAAYADNFPTVTV